MSPWSMLVNEVRLAGEHAIVCDRRVELDGLEPAARVERLASALYEEWHVGGSSTVTLQADEQYCRRLADLHTAAAVPERGWHSLGPCGNGVVRVARDGVRVDVPRAAVDGETVHMPPVRWRWTVGFLAFLSSQGQLGTGVARFYVNRGPARLSMLLSRLLEALEGDGRPYVLKTANNPRLLDLRRDGTVLYVPLADAPGVWRHVQELTGDGEARPETSRLARRLGPGISYAQEPTASQPPGSRSFGQHRATLLARYLLEDGGDLDNFLRASGVAPDAPHLELGVRDELGELG